MKNNEPEKLLSEISIHFDFLLKHGFQINHAEYREEHMGGNWNVSLTTNEFSIVLSEDRADVSLIILHKPDRQSFSLHTIVFYLSKGNEFIGIYQGEYRDRYYNRSAQLARLAKILFRYIDKISILFGEDFEKHLGELKSSQEKVTELYYRAMAEKLNRLGH